jgi:hypothetical protein
MNFFIDYPQLTLILCADSFDFLKAVSIQSTESLFLQLVFSLRKTGFNLLNGFDVSLEKAGRS